MTFNGESDKIMIVFQEVNFMRLSILITSVFLCCGAVANAGYDYIIEDSYFAVLTLNDHETLLMTRGGGIY